MGIPKINVNFDFTTDTPRFWDNYWDFMNGIGRSAVDPDTASPMLKKYQQILWSKELPNGEVMALKAGTGAKYLTWTDFRFGSDSITSSFRYKKNRSLLEQVQSCLPDYRRYMENYVRSSYTIGGEIIFPKRHGGINQTRGCNQLISDRWDRTLECIRKFYNGEESPLYQTLLADKAFFDLFVDFKGYIDFFFLQDCVSKDYTSVEFYIGNGDFNEYPFPQSVDQYTLWIEKTLEFVQLRNERIRKEVEGNYTE